MTDLNHTHLIQNIYRQALRRLFLICLINNLIFFSIFAIIIFDFFLITKLTYSISALHLLLVLVTSVISIATYRTLKTLPTTYFVLAAIDHNAGTRGAFSLLNELSNKEKKNSLIQVLATKCSLLSKSISLNSIFPWNFSWNHYLGATIAFTVLLLVALPKHKKIEKIDLLSQLTKNDKTFTIDKKDDILEKFKSNENIKQSLNPQNTLEDPSKTILKNKLATENINSNQTDQTTAKSDNQINSEKSLAKETESTKLNGEQSSSGSGNEEKQTDKTITLTQKTGKETKSDIKISLKDGINQDGSSERVNSQVKTIDSKTGNQIQSLSEIKTHKIAETTNMVSSKYQKIIERYFSSDE